VMINQFVYFIDKVKNLFKDKRIHKYYFCLRGQGLSYKYAAETTNIW